MIIINKSFIQSSAKAMTLVTLQYTHKHGHITQKLVFQTV